MNLLTPREPALSPRNLLMLVLAGVLPMVFSAQTVAQDAPAKNQVRLASSPALSPDGKTLVFSWQGDLWITPSSGGEARLLTSHSGYDGEPAFSPDGKQLAFISDRDGSRQAYVMPAARRGR